MKLSWQPKMPERVTPKESESDLDRAIEAMERLVDEASENWKHQDIYSLQESYYEGLQAGYDMSLRVMHDLKSEKCKCREDEIEVEE